MNRVFQVCVCVRKWRPSIEENASLVVDNIKLSPFFSASFSFLFYFLDVVEIYAV